MEYDYIGSVISLWDIYLQMLKKKKLLFNLSKYTKVLFVKLHQLDPGSVDPYD